MKSISPWVFAESRMRRKVFSANGQPQCLMNATTCRLLFSIWTTPLDGAVSPTLGAADTGGPVGLNQDENSCWNVMSLVDIIRRNLQRDGLYEMNLYLTCSRRRSSETERILVLGTGTVPDTARLSSASFGIATSRRNGIAEERVGEMD